MIKRRVRTCENTRRVEADSGGPRTEIYLLQDERGRNGGLNIHGRHERWAERKAEATHEFAATSSELYNQGH